METYLIVSFIIAGFTIGYGFDNFDDLFELLLAYIICFVFWPVLVLMAWGSNTKDLDNDT